tara:strand:- start:706 stop:1323 length:618 start_codon:yes stop_codon:yes gene_type:complete
VKLNHQMAYKYKLKEEPFNIGDTDVRGGVKSTITDLDPETGAITWDIKDVPAIDSTFKEFKKLRTFMTQLARNTEDTVIDDLADQISKVFNQYRTHIRKKYPKAYKKVNEEDVDEMSMSGGAGAYQTPYAFRKKGQKPNDKAYTALGYTLAKENVGATLGPGPKATEDGVKDNAYVKQFKYKLVPKNSDGTYVQKGSGLEVKKLY